MKLRSLSLSLQECDRIAAMVSELSRLGVECGELSDGIWIRGLSSTEYREGAKAVGTAQEEGEEQRQRHLLHHRQQRQQGQSVPRAVIRCYNDHRIAMSFAVLGAAVPGIVISDKVSLVSCE